MARTCVAPPSPTTEPTALAGPPAPTSAAPVLLVEAGAAFPPSLPLGLPLDWRDSSSWCVKSPMFHSAHCEQQAVGEEG